MTKHTVECTVTWTYEIDLDSDGYEFAEGDLKIAMQGNAEADLEDLLTGRVKLVQRSDSVITETIYDDNF